MRKIFAFGNEYFEGDEVAKVLARKMSVDGFEFVIAQSPNEILNESDEIIILDVVKGLKSVKIIDDIEDLVLSSSLTCHDLDLGFYLKMMKGSGKIFSVKIIGLPYGNRDYDFLKKEVEKILNII